MPTPDPSRLAPVALILDTVDPRWQQHVTHSGAIDFPAMKRALGHSSTEALRIDAARSLWHGRARISLEPVAHSLDNYNRAALLGAVAMAPSVLHGRPVSPSRALALAAQLLEARRQ